MRFQGLTTYFSICVLLISCHKKEVGPQCPSCEEVITPQTTDILIGCEGNYGWGNASITRYNPTNKTVSQQVFVNVNGFSLGDVLQSFYQNEDQLYAVLNNSGKIEIIDTANYSSKGSISGFTSPRYIAIEDNIGYVSDLYSNNITKFDVTTNQIVGSVACGRWTELLLIQNNELYITCPDTNWVLKYDINNNLFADTINVGTSPSGMIKTTDQKIWILSSGGISQTIPKLVEYNGTQVTKTLSFNGVNNNPTSLKYDSIRNCVLYIDNGAVFEFDLNANSIPSTAKIQSNGSTFYNLEIDPKNSDIYVTDAIDYVQSGKVYRFDSLYNPIDTFTTGIIPQAIWFK